jgi:death-on-curing protein
MKLYFYHFVDWSVMADGAGPENDQLRVEFITVGELKKIHRRLIDVGPEDEAPLRDAVRDEATLDFIAIGANKIADPLERAAFLLHRIATWHPFFEGNKRTAFTAADGTLRVYSKMRINESPEKIDVFIRSVASGKTEETEVVSWLETVATELIR